MQETAITSKSVNPAIDFLLLLFCVGAFALGRIASDLAVAGNGVVR